MGASLRRSRFQSMHSTSRTLTARRIALSLLSLPLVTALLLPQTAAADELAVPRTAPLLVNSSNGDHWLGNTPNVAINGEGLLMAAWTDGNAHGSLDDWSTAVAGQLVTQEGVLSGPNFVINENNKHEQGFVRLAVTASDGFVATYNTRTLDGNGSLGVGQRYVLSGQGEFGANTFTDREQVAATVATSRNGSEVVTWQSKHLDPYRWEIFASLNGGLEFRVSSDLDGDNHARVAMDPEGNFAIVWQRKGDLIMRSYDASGAPLTDERVANPVVSYTQRDPEIAALPTGGYLVVWEDDSTPNRRMQIMGRVFDTNGDALSDRFTISDIPEDHAVDAAVAADPNGRAVVSWTHNPEIRVRLIDTETLTLGPVFDTGVMSQVQQGSSAVAMGDADEFAVAWRAVDDVGKIYVRQYDIVSQ